MKSVENLGELSKMRMFLQRVAPVCWPSLLAHPPPQPSIFFLPFSFLPTCLLFEQNSCQSCARYNCYAYWSPWPWLCHCTGKGWWRIKGNLGPGGQCEVRKKVRECFSVTWTPEDNVTCFCSSSTSKNILFLSILFLYIFFLHWHKI